MIEKWFPLDNTGSSNEILLICTHLVNMKNLILSLYSNIIY